MREAMCRQKIRWAIITMKHKDVAGGLGTGSAGVPEVNRRRLSDGALSPPAGRPSTESRNVIFMMPVKSRNVNGQDKVSISIPVQFPWQVESGLDRGTQVGAGRHIRICAHFQGTQSRF
ncbi:unnamed protein product [Linum trigynum]|uniref:Uncharacterized protein n=1 Tax=Linum trigynum TaxID=586398 RepID=A0AAV2D551_9ROSI